MQDVRSTDAVEEEEENTTVTRKRRKRRRGGRSSDVRVTALTLVVGRTEYRVTQKNIKNLLFQQFCQLEGCYCSYLLPSLDGGKSQI